MAIKERKQITGTEAQIKGYAGHNGVLAYATDTKHLHVLSGTAGTTTKLANVSDIPAPMDISGKTDKTYVDTGLAGKADKAHTHTVSQITDMSKVVLSVNDIKPASNGNVSLGLHAVAASGDYNDLTNKPMIPSTPNAYVTLAWKAGGNWCRRWSDGFIEQAGVFTAANERLVTLCTDFSTTSYVVFLNAVDTDNHFLKTVYKRTVSTFQVKPTDSKTLDYYWYACGY